MSKEPLEAEPLEADEFPVASTVPTASGRRPGPSNDRYLTLAMVGSAVVIAILLLAGWQLDWFAGDEDEDPSTNQRPVVNGLRWYDPVWMPRNPQCVDPNNGQDHPEYAIGYEPSIAVDSDGNLFYTAHKDLTWAGPDGGSLRTAFDILDGNIPPGGSPYLLACDTPAPPPYSEAETSWDYYASWFYVSQDGGETWGPPNDWGTEMSGYQSGSMVYPGDEGDIGIDANDRVYYIDTYLEDNWLHVWDDGGNSYVRGTRQNTQALDDRPWITAQGDELVHYLGNSGTMIPDCFGEGGRYWYYRSTDGGVTFSQCYAMPGGWSHIDAERDGEHIYVVQESHDTGSEEYRDIQVRVSDDTVSVGPNPWSSALPRPILQRASPGSPPVPPPTRGWWEPSGPTRPEAVPDHGDCMPP